MLRKLIRLSIALGLLCVVTIASAQVKIFHENGTHVFPGVVEMGPTPSPGTKWTDSDFVVKDTACEIAITCPTVGDGTEDCNMAFICKNDGADVTWMLYNADGALITIAGNGEHRLRGIAGTSRFILIDEDDAELAEHFVISVNCTDVGAGTDDCDVTFSNMIAGTEIPFIVTDADGQIVFGNAQQSVKTIHQNGAAPAATCVVGEIFLDTDETDDTNCTTTADNSLCLCTATDTWTALENN